MDKCLISITIILLLTEVILHIVIFLFIPADKEYEGKLGDFKDINITIFIFSIINLVVIFIFIILLFIYCCESKIVCAIMPFTFIKLTLIIVEWALSLAIKGKVNDIKGNQKYITDPLCTIDFRNNAIIWLLSSILLLNIIELFINLCSYGKCCNCNCCDERKNQRSNNELAQRANENKIKRITIQNQVQYENEEHKGAVIATDGNNLVIGTMRIQSHRKRNRWAFAYSDA